MAGAAPQGLPPGGLVDPEVIACPYPLYARLHAEAPVWQDPATGFFVITRYADMQAVIRDTESFSNDLLFLERRPRTAPAEAERILREEGYARPQVLQRNDPPRHARYRRLVDRAFTASRVRAMQPYIAGIVDELVAPIAAAAARGEPVEFMSAFAIPLPSIVIADQIGVPRADVASVRRWTDALLDPVGLMISPEREVECARETVEFQRYFAARIAERRAHPRDDMLSALVAEMEGEEPLSTEEVLNLLEQLLTGGNETTTNALGSALLLLLRHPEEEAKLRADPSLVANFVEEALRMETPVQGLFREARRDVTLGGVTIPKGAVVMLRHGAVNRDPEKFEEPDRFDVCRANAGAQLAFGAGVHFCPGAMLARAEMATAFRTLLDRFAGFELAEPDFVPRYRPSFFLRGLERLPVRFRLAGTA
ncbi:cytochrome P450 [Thermaurantiacus tibetensis]|uniref:cytochrome P450 n=1 Tax=Thermaurantiacus tibetensis TaxID=2759035 RepID=UPI00188E1ECB|nr:cytochrome P450 [Thermaurantiacus tibetensis]